MLRQLNDLFLVVFIVILDAVVLLLMPGIVVLRVLCAILLGLILPGYALSMALFPGHILDIPQRILFTLSLSVVATILTGLTLALFNQPLQLNSWSLVLATITLVATLVAAWGRRSSDSPVAKQEMFQFKPNVREGVLLGLALFVAGAAFQLARVPTPNPQVSGYTLLWMVPAQDVPNQLRIGVDSKELDTTNYNVQLFDNGHLLQQWSDLELKSGGSWQTTVAVTATQAFTSTIEARLYRSDAPDQIYRHVSFVHSPQ